tara:strand:- start:118 stop:315 length:198 start_codon:yes stop_codon:yes gene_type:complete
MRMDVSLLIQATAASALKPEKALFLFPFDGRSRKPEMFLHRLSVLDLSQVGAAPACIFSISVNYR